MRRAPLFDEVADAWREILEVVSMPVSEPDAPHTPPPDFRPRKEMSCKACDIKFLNFNTWKQHQVVVHDMSIKDWTLVYEQRDALKRNRAQKRYALCLSRNLIEVAAVNTVVDEEPGTKPLLVASTVWRQRR